MTEMTAFTLSMRLLKRVISRELQSEEIHASTASSNKKMTNADLMERCFTNSILRLVSVMAAVDQGVYIYHVPSDRTQATQIKRSPGFKAQK